MNTLKAGCIGWLKASFYALLIGCIVCTPAQAQQATMFLGAPGSATRPTYSWYLDPGTGFYRASSGQIGIASLGVASAILTQNSAGGGLYIGALGSNQNIRLVPSGTGGVILAGTSGANLSQRTSVNAAGMCAVFTLQSDAKTANDGIQFSFEGQDSASNAQSYALIRSVFTTTTNGAEAGKLQFWVPIVGTITNTVTFDENGRLLGLHATGGIGYGTGAGGTVTQITSKATGVTLNKVSGQITLHNAALASDTTVSFTLTNSAIAVGDVLILNHITNGTPGAYTLNARCGAGGAGSAEINVRNVTTGSLSEAITISYVVIKAVSS